MWSNAHLRLTNPRRANCRHSSKLRNIEPKIWFLAFDQFFLCTSCIVFYFYLVSVSCYIKWYTMSTFLFAICCDFRRRELLAPVSVIKRPTPFAIVAVIARTTGRTTSVDHVVTQRRRWDDVRFGLFRISFQLFLDNWSRKAKRRRTIGTGRCRYLKNAIRRGKNGFRDGQVPRAQSAAKSS